MAEKEAGDLGRRNLKLHGYLDEPDEGFEQGDCSNSSPQDDIFSLSPLQRLQKCAQSTDIFDRRVVPRVVQDLFRNAPADQLNRDLPEIMKVLTKIGEESLLRVDFLEHIPNIAVQAVENSTRVTSLKDVVSDHLIPLVVRNLGCSDTAVDKAAQASLIYLVEKGYVSKLQAEIKVCPAVLALSKTESHLDVNFGAVTLMSKLAPLLGRDITERIFLKRFSELCESNMFYVRKISASLLGSFCAVVGPEAFKKTVLPCYVKLCSDEIWGVRKSCAEVIMFISSVCPADLRKSTLAPIFSKLLQDDCRWVRMSAFQTLGPFISTFANPPLTSLSYNHNGEVVLINGSGSEFVQPACSDYFPHNASVTAEGEVSFEDFFWNGEIESKELELESGLNIENSGLVGSGEIKDNVDSIIESVVNNTKRNEVESQKSKIDNNSNQIGEGAAEQVTSLVSCCGMQPSDNLLFYNEYNYWYIRPGNVELDCDIVRNTNLFRSEGDHPNKMEKLEELCSKMSLNDENAIKLETSEVKLAHIKCDNKPETTNNANTLDTQLNMKKSDDNKNCGENVGNKINLKSKETNLFEVATSENANKNLAQNKSLEENLTDVPLENKTSEENAVEVPSELSSKENNVLPIQTPKENLNQVPEEIILQRPEENIAAQVSPAKEDNDTVAPRELVNFFVSMTDPKVALNIDNDMRYHCAYSMPAVVLTLGKENWPILKKTVDLLAGDMQYKVRRTMASSLHELAFILGPQVASDDLSPLFDGFLKDLDEVRIGILTNLAHFLSLINPEKRYEFLPKLGEFLRVDNVCNWRFRETLARQLELSVRLYRPPDIVKHIGLFAQALMLDKVSAVKQAALYLVTETIKNISMEHGLASSYLAVIAERFAHSKKWKPRQTFALLCSLLLARKVLPLDEFSNEVLPHLLDLSWDPVSNVRLVVAKCFAEHILEMDYFLDPENDHQQALENVLRRFQADKDSEVRKTVDMYTTYTFGICKKEGPKD